MKQITIAEAIQRTVEHREVFHDEMLHVMRQIMRGELTPAQIAGFIMGLRVTEGDEYDGLDITQHGESGYNLEDAYSATFAGGGGATIAHDSVEVSPSVSRA